MQSAKKIYRFSEFNHNDSVDLKNRLKVKGSYNDYVRNRDRIEQNNKLIKTIIGI